MDQPKKRAAFGLAALLLVCCCHFDTVIAETATEAAAEEAPTQVSETSETEEAVQEAATEPLSTVTVIHTAEISEEEYTPTDWWKADLDSYDDSFSLISYRAVQNPDAENAEFIAESPAAAEDAVVYSSAPTPSAVSSVSDGYFAFSTYGYGHGVGMSQNGANFYAINAGWNYQDILFHYYPGTTLMNTGTAETEAVKVQGVPGNVLRQVAEIVNREVGPSFHTEAIKAQAVAVYTYMKYHGNDAADLKGKPNPPQNIIDACASVLGEALYYNGNYALTMFYASSGGITANCSDVFNQDIPYLRSVSSDYDAAYDPHYGDVVYFSVDQLRARLQSAYGIRLSS
ncbi:MAG: sporulation protein, partial [Oscillospiraceae bacterium]|nr:sporulation protein [Oscillospiraceae bacterium]